MSIVEFSRKKDSQEKRLDKIVKKFNGNYVQIIFYDDAP